MEELLMYLPPAIVDGTLAFMAGNSARGSAILIDCIPAPVVGGTCELEAGRKWRKGVADAGEPFLFGIAAEGLEAFLPMGFAKIRNVAAGDDREMFFKGENADVLSSFAHAVVEWAPEGNGPYPEGEREIGDTNHY